jgi:uncharacterized membrane protein
MKRIVSRWLQPIGRCFLAGLLAILPVVLTLAIVAWVAAFIQLYVGPGTPFGEALAALGVRFGTEGLLAYIFGWALVLVTVFLLGLLVQLGAQRFLKWAQDSLLLRIPLIGSIYGTSKQIVEMFSPSKTSDLKGMSVVFCSFGAGGGPGVLALMPSSERFRIDGRDYHVVIIPTAPVPFGGGLLFMPVELVRPSSISVDGLMSVYVSMGVTTGQFLPSQDKAKSSV